MSNHTEQSTKEDLEKTCKEIINKWDNNEFDQSVEKFILFDRFNDALSSIKSRLKMIEKYKGK